VNGDGIDDLIVGDPIMTGAAGYAGGVRIFYGRKFVVSSTVIELSSEPADLAIVGDSNSGDCARSIACADVNGDGIDDVIMGDYFGRGTVFVIYGRTDFEPNGFIDLKLEAADITIEGRLYAVGPNGDLGKAVGVLDFNGDGISDIIAGAPNLYNPREDTCPGQVYLIYGKKDFPLKHTIDLSYVSADLEIYGETDGEQCGRWLAGGDINGDGYGDILMGAPTPETPDFSKGHVYVLFGEPDVPSGTLIDFAEFPPPLTVVGEHWGDQIGRVSSGDLNGDGFDDLVCSSPFHFGGNGRVYVIKGYDSFPDSKKWYLENAPADYTVEGPGWLGWYMSCGDVSGDGIDDLVMGRPYGIGYAEVVFGSLNFGDPDFLDLSTTLPDIRVKGVISYLGQSVGTCDLNNDGFKDVAAASPTEGYLNAHGAAYVVFSGGAMPYGEGLAGSGGIVPNLSNSAGELPVISTGKIELHVSDGLGGAAGYLFFGLAQGSLPFKGGSFLLDPWVMFLNLPIVLSNAGGGAGAGEMTLPMTIPDIPELNIIPLYFQAALNDPDAAQGVSLTPGLQVSFLSKGE
jgi:hypothetical protein